MNMETEMTTFIPVSSKAVGKTIKDIESFGVKVGHYYLTPATFNQHYKPEPNIELKAGMGINITGQRTKIHNLCNALGLP